MTSKTPRCSAGWPACGLLLLSALGLAGCGPASSTLRIESYKDPHFPEPLLLHLDDCVYRRDSAGDYHVLGHAGPEDEPPLTPEPAPENSSSSPPDDRLASAANNSPTSPPAGSRTSASNAVRQYVHLHVFWRPQPGRTYANETTTDAVIRYIIATPEGTAVYGGTGFVYLHPERGGVMELELEAGRLKPEEQIGEPPEVLGLSRISGTLRARHDSGAAVDLLRTLDHYVSHP